MKTVELLNKLHNTLPDSTNGVFWTDDILFYLENMISDGEFSNKSFIAVIEKFLPKIETDYEDRADDYGYALWKIGDTSELAKTDVDIANIIEYIGTNNFSQTVNDNNDNAKKLRRLVETYRLAHLSTNND